MTNPLKRFFLAGYASDKENVLVMDIQDGTGITNLTVQHMGSYKLYSSQWLFGGIPF